MAATGLQKPSSGRQRPVPAGPASVLSAASWRTCRSLRGCGLRASFQHLMQLLLSRWRGPGSEGGCHGELGPRAVRVLPMRRPPGSVCRVQMRAESLSAWRIIDGELHALDNWCPHRRGPLGQRLGRRQCRGVSVAFSWAFNTVHTGLAEPPERARVDGAFQCVVR